MFGFFGMAYPDFLRTSVFVVLAAGFLNAGSTIFAQAENVIGKALEVTIDRAKVVRIPRAGDTVVVGNPGIIDATIQDARTLILTGRSFGVTNLIVLDKEGDPIIDESIVVKGHEINTVRVYRRAARETLACSPICEPTLTVGDDRTIFDNSASQSRAKQELSKADD